MLTVVIPALNEELRLPDTIETVRMATAAAGVRVYEIIIVNDGSTDRTAEVISQLEAKYPFIRSIHFKENLGLGAGFRAAVDIAKYPKISTFPGDNCCRPEIMYKLFRGLGEADMVLSYLVNVEERAWKRRILSMFYSYAYVLTFQLPIKYMNGSPIYPVARLKGLELKAMRYGVFAEINVKLIRSGVTFAEVPDYVKPNQTKTSAVRMRNLLETLRVYLRLIYEIHFSRRDKFNRTSKRVFLEFCPPPDFTVLAQNR